MTAYLALAIYCPKMVGYITKPVCGQCNEPLHSRVCTEVRDIPTQLDSNADGSAPTTGSDHKGCTKSFSLIIYIRFIHVLLNPPRPPPWRLPNLTLGGTNLRADMASVIPFISWLSFSEVPSKAGMTICALPLSSAICWAAELLLRCLPI